LQIELKLVSPEVVEGFVRAEVVIESES
jgi:hypothetical protein